MKLPLLTPAKLLRRYKRFLADCELSDGEVVQVHCPNPGSMRSCAEAGQPVLLSWHADQKRKLPWTWELYWSGASWVTINTQRPNAVVAEALRKQQIVELAGYRELRREVAFGERERVDFWLGDPERGEAFVEVKSCTLLDEDGVLRFPDAPSSRALRHLQALERERSRGHRAVLLFLLGREDGHGFAPADAIDSNYGAALRRARERGVEVLAYRSRVRPDNIELCDAEPLLF
ncbi:DNA/RNA nuclease SfsA [Acidithiobacillus sp. AMEEHan]|uniref:DNA/RNA nuclease SfsA n=1 Tax=Acidithiobacillus sp. AMEEHan TaxID=2994951 RepID=UPI0027E4C5F6|nr:DNA/RNA nuclease SfsA [Acidithiobacillus sp. AMEEHan]